MILSEGGEPLKFSEMVGRRITVNEMSIYNNLKF
jgi:hypothetical protein